MTPAPPAASDLASYLPVALILVMAVGFAAANIILSRIIGPNRPGGVVKGQTYESGMNPVGTARKRFNVRFYLIAMVFLVFDVEIVFLYPLAVQLDALAWFGLAELLVFIGILALAYVYIWRKGALDWR